MVLDPNWPRISRWCVLLAIVMLVWLLAPVAKCSFGAFQDTPVGHVDDNTDPGQADAQRVEQSKGFFSTWGHRTKVCYQRTPIFGQEDWKSTLLIAFASIAALSWLLARLERSRR